MLILNKIAIISIVQFISNCHGFSKSNNKSVIDIEKSSPIIIYPTRPMKRFYSKFKLTKTQPYEHRHPILKEGNDVILSCKANLRINSCIFKHKNKKCKIGHALDILNCNDYSDRIEPYYSEKTPIGRDRSCAIKLISVSFEDGGEWFCDVESQEIISKSYRPNLQ